MGVVLQVTKALIDMENMFELLATEPRVQDEPHAATLQVSNGTVEFKQVRQGVVAAASLASQFVPLRLLLASQWALNCGRMVCMACGH